MRAAGIPNLIVCIDADRDCGRDDLPHDATVVRFRKRIDVQDVLRAMAAADGDTLGKL